MWVDSSRPFPDGIERSPGHALSRLQARVLDRPPHRHFGDPCTSWNRIFLVHFVCRVKDQVSQATWSSSCTAPISRSSPHVTKVCVRSHDSSIGVAAERRGMRIRFLRDCLFHSHHWLPIRLVPGALSPVLEGAGA
jgi:hypothetical protein